ncbi:MAG: DUF3015 family protein [Oligoflexia bacterium]|nr:DUF3015 family protein [Oligoflexia bacterium]
MLRCLSILFYFSLITFFLFSFNDFFYAQAAPKKRSIHDKVTAPKYGMAGCGLGSILFGEDDSKWTQVMAATTNGTFGSNTFGVSSGTSNCDTGATAGTGTKSSLIRKNTEIFIAANQIILMNDASKMGGESIEVLGKILNCDNEGVKELSRSLQKNYNLIFVDSNGSLMNSSQLIAKNIFKEIELNSVLSGKCKSNI